MARTQETFSPGAPSQVARGPVGNFRWVICGLLFLSTMVNYMDRQIIGILKPELSHRLGWSDQGYADIVAAFQYAYAVGYLYGGRLMDWFGVKRTYPVTAFLWSIAAMAHGLVRSTLGFSVVRAGLGLSEGGNFPAAIKTVGEWFPLRERSLATGLFNSASNIGAIVCPLTVPFLALHYGWQASFYIIGALGLLWVVLWACLYDAPETHRSLSVPEREYIEEGRAPTAPTAGTVSWISLLRSRANWAYMIAGILSGPVWWFYLFWLPDFLTKRFHLSSTRMGVYVGIIYTISIVGSIAGGWLATYLIQRGWTLNKARKLSMLICALCVLPVCIAAFATNVWVAVIVIGIAAAAHQGWSANLYTFVSDTMPKRAVSSVVGLGGFVSGISSGFVTLGIGYILTKTGSYVPAFLWASTMYVLSLLFIHILVPQIRQENIAP